MMTLLLEKEGGPPPDIDSATPESNLNNSDHTSKVAELQGKPWDGKTVDEILEAADIDEEFEHQFLKANKIKPHGAVLYKNYLVIQGRVLDEIKFLQFIALDGSTQFYPGFVNGGRSSIGSVKSSLEKGEVHIAVDFITAARNFEKTGIATAIAFTPENVQSVRDYIIKKYPDLKINVISSEPVENAAQPEAMPTPINRKSSPSEDELALTFAEKHKDLLKFDHTRGAWFKWDGSRWAVEKTRLAFDWARSHCRNHGGSKKNGATLRISTASAVEKGAQADRRLAVTSETWDSNDYLLCTPGGTVDLKTGKLSKNRPENYMTRQTGATPSTMSTPIWTEFLDQVTGGDLQFQKYLQKVAGYCLTGDTREHALFFIYGPGGNGKGVFVNTISGVMGNYATSAPMDTFTASKYDGHPTELADLNGPRLVTASETEEGRGWAESRIKQLTGGDPIKARFMRQDFFEFKPHFKLIIMGNHKPILKSVDDAARRRFNIIPFAYKPTVVDKALEDKLKAEYDGILAWMIQGYLEWQKTGLKPPQVVQQETEAYFADQDTFSQWLADCTEKKFETTGETTARLYASWSDYAALQGEDIGTVRRFCEKMAVAGFEKVRHTPGHHGQRGFRGVQLKAKDKDKDKDTDWKPYSED